MGDVHRAMTGFRRDDDGAWVAELSCLHSQHIRHEPPFWEAAWIEDDEARGERVGQPLDCPLCDRAELPGGAPRQEDDRHLGRRHRPPPFAAPIVWLPARGVSSRSKPARSASTPTPIHRSTSS